MKNWKFSGDCNDRSRQICTEKTCFLWKYWSVLIILLISKTSQFFPAERIFTVDVKVSRRTKSIVSTKYPRVQLIKPNQLEQRTKDRIRVLVRGKIAVDLTSQCNETWKKKCRQKPGTWYWKHNTVYPSCISIPDEVTRKLQPRSIWISRLEMKPTTTSARVFFFVCEIGSIVVIKWRFRIQSVGTVGSLKLKSVPKFFVVISSTKKLFI